MVEPVGAIDVNFPDMAKGKHWAMHREVATYWMDMNGVIAMLAFAAKASIRAKHRFRHLCESSQRPLTLIEYAGHLGRWHCGDATYTGEGDHQDLDKILKVGRKVVPA